MHKCACGADLGPEFTGTLYICADGPNGGPAIVSLDLGFTRFVENTSTAMGEAHEAASPYDGEGDLA